LKKAVNGTKVIDNMNPAPALTLGAVDVVDGVTSITNTINPITAAWGPLLEKVRQFSKVVDVISEV
jgi:hypothetical protein